MVFGYEVGESGTPHLQGYIEFKGSKRFTTLKKLFPRAHLEKRLGTADQAARYCKKDGDYEEYGEISKQGKRTDLDIVTDMVVMGATVEEVAKAFPKSVVLYGSGLNRLRYICQGHRTEKPIVQWFYGLAGTGKTREAMEIGKTQYIKDGTFWWDGYEQQETIVIDDFDGKWPYRDLLRLLDRYPYQGQIKGGYVKINSKYIIITCEHPPSHFWVKNELAQVARRLDCVKEIGGSEVAEVPGNTNASLSGTNSGFAGTTCGLLGLRPF